MTLDSIIDLLTSVVLILGAFLSLAAGVGLLRFPDAIARMHATTKPQILGLIFILMGIALQERKLSIVLMLVTVLLFQMMTAPISAHMIGRAGYRSGVVAPGSLLVDELGQAIELAQREQIEAEHGDPSADSSDQDGVHQPNADERTGPDRD